MVAPVRTLVAWCLDWPVVALGHRLDEPVAVLYANRVVAASPAARSHGVQRGLRRREAQARCPDLLVVERDHTREVHQFEPIVGALDDVVARVEIIRPGTCALPVKGPSRYFGGDESAAQRIADCLTEAMAATFGGTGSEDTAGRICEVRVGVADGLFAAGLAARAAQPVMVVPVGDTPAFLAPLPVTVLERPDLTHVVSRLGLPTLGAFARLPSAKVVGRFGAEGLAAHRLASGLDERPSGATAPPPDWAVSIEIDPPADRVDRVAFCARSLAEELHVRLDREGVACVSVAIEAETEHGETLVRYWRHEGTLSASAVADRVRWQLDGWLNKSAAGRPSGGIARVTLIPDQIVVARGRQLGFWGGETEADERAARVAARLHGQLGSGAVSVLEARGGRHFDEQLSLIPAAAVELRGRKLAAPASGPDGPEPWPGRLPVPSPAQVLPTTAEVEVRAADGSIVSVSGRGLPSAPPTQLVIGSAVHEVTAWAGPWPVDERWWDSARQRRRVRFQLLTDDGVARLVALESQKWSIEAIWD